MQPGYLHTWLTCPIACIPNLHVFAHPHPQHRPPPTDVLAEDLTADSEFQRFAQAAQQGNLVPLYERVMSDQLTPVLAYRCLVREDDRDAPSFLFESVVNGDQQGRYSFVGAQPSLEVVATKGQVVVLDHEAGTRTETQARGWCLGAGGGAEGCWA